MILLLLFVGLLLLVAIDVPIAIALGTVTVVAVFLTSGVDALPNVALVLYTGATKFSLDRKSVV